MRTSDQFAQFAAAWVACQPKLPKVPKDRDGQVGDRKITYADLETVLDLCIPVLAENGFAFLSGCSGLDGKVVVTTRLIHTSGEWIEDSLPMPTGQGTAQAVGSAISYGRRYSLTAMLGIATFDDDGHAASQTKPAPRKQAAPRQSAPPRETGTQADPNMASSSQQRFVHILFTKANVKDRDAQMKWLSENCHRPITSTAELTKAEVNEVIKELELMAGGK